MRDTGILVLLIVALTMSAVHSKCSPPEAIEKKLEAKMEKAAKEGKEYNPPEDPVKAFMKMYPKMMHDALPRTVDCLKNVKSYSKIAMSAEDATDHAENLALLARTLANVTRLVNEHVKFTSSSLLKFYRMETIPAKFFRPLRQEAKFAGNAIKLYMEAKQASEGKLGNSSVARQERLELELAASAIDDYLITMRQLDEKKTEMYLTVLLEEMRNGLKLEEILARLPHKSDLHKNFKEGQLIILASRLSAATGERIEDFFKQLVQKLPDFLMAANNQITSEWTAVAVREIGNKSGEMVRTPEGLDTIRTTLKALVMALRNTAEFPADRDLVAALTDKLFLGEQALAIEKCSAHIASLSKTVDYLTKSANERTQNIRDDLNSVAGSIQAWTEFETVSDAVKSEQVELENDSDSERMEKTPKDNIRTGNVHRPYVGTGKDEF